MGSSTLLVGLILLQISWTLEATLHYAVIFPSEFRSQHAEHVCIDLEGAQGESRVQLSLNLGAKNTTLIDRRFQEDSAFTCIPVKAPHPSEGEDQVGTLTVSIENAKDNIVKSSKVLVKKERTSILVQTDKAVYKPGQTVKFRILSLNEDLQPENKQFPVVELQDPSKNRIGQWLNVNLNQGLADLSLPLSSEPQLGEYSIRVDKTVHTFSVEEYVLPKFEVTLQFPKYVMFNSEHFSVQLCGRYTYGKPVQGNYTAKVCRNPIYYGWRPVPRKESELCVHFSGKLDESGCHNLEAKAETLKLKESTYEKALRATASIFEEGTGIELSTTSQTSISTVIDKVSFVDADSSYKRGIPYKGLIKVVDAGDSPKGGVTVYLQSGDGSINQTLLTNENGKVSFTLNTENWERTVFLKASTNRQLPRYVSAVYQADYGFASLSLEPFYSRNKNFLKLHSLDRVLPCEGQQEVQAEYIINHADLKETKHLDLHYLVVSEGSIQDSGSVEITTESGSEDLHGEVTLKLPLSAGISPKLHALVYIFLPNGEILADSATFNLLRCFKNKVSVGFSPNEVLPGSDVSLNVQAAPGSLCGLRVVDQSVVLMKPEKELTEDKVYDLFPLRLSKGYDYRIDEPGHRCFPPIFPPMRPRPVLPGLSQRRTTRSVIYPFYDEADHDVYSLFQGMSLKIVTSDNIKKPRKCWDQIVLFSAHPGLPGPAGPDIMRNREFDSAPNVPVMENLPETVKESEKEEQRVRAYFPETWIWELFPLGDSSSAYLHHKAPDTITDWNARAVCMGPSGFGLSPSSSLRVFQPFFVELTLPYSVVRGESFPCKASVFNYLKQCIKVQVTLQPTLELEQTPCADCEYSSCLCADQSKTFIWNLKASKLGEVNITVKTEAVDTNDLCQNEIPVVPKQGSTDIVVKPLLVQPGGVLVEKAHSSLLCIKEGEEHNTREEISLTIPDNTLKDSERAHITVLGDLMGTAMQNLDRLLAMPYGCGEQNMVLFAPNIFILQYLEKSHQLNPEIKSKAVKFLESGYQRELTYKHDDGSYSAFGKNDAEGNTWLTAFVTKSFNKARPYIFIDTSHLNDSITWLRKHRHENGCFRSVGKLFNNAMKGGVDDETSLSAYVTIALLETGLPVEDPLVKDAVSCLRKAAAGVTSVYTQALLLYTFTLSGETELRKMLMDKLDAKAVKGEGQLHWVRESAPASDVPYWYRAPSAEVELAAYVLLALVSGSTKDVGKASQIVNWLTKQQNPYGGYSSTQDTVVAIQALAKYAEVTFSDKGDVTVTVSSTTGFQHQFHVNNNNRLLLQQASLPSIPGEYTVSSTGGGCVYVQTVLRYNVPPPKKDTTFSLTVKPFTRRHCLKNQVTKFEILINASYTGSREKSNMAVIEVKMLSGWIPVKSTVKKLEKDKLIQRSDIQTDMVTLYLDEVGHTPVDLFFMVEQEIEVKDLKPATVKVYDYYETDDQAISEYNHPCTEENAGNSR